MELNELQKAVHGASVQAGWWEGVDVDSITPVKIALIHSEVSEALEGHRKLLKDDHLVDRDMLEVELADAVIRILDLAEAWDYDIESTILDKMRYNAQRADHKIENRNAEGGKRY